MKNNLLMVINPNAGKKQIRNYLFEIVDILEKADFCVTVKITQYSGHAKEIVEQIGENFGYVIACGGDGTIDEVINGIMSLEIKPTLGVLPCGTINDLASSFGISKNLLEAAKQFASGQSFVFDIGSFQDYYFSYVAAFGMFTEVPYATSQSYKNVFGRIAYLVEGLKSIAKMPVHNVKVTHSSGSFEGEYIFGAIANTLSVAGFNQFRKVDISFSDGLFEGLFIKKTQNPFEFQQMMVKFIAQDYDEKYFTFVQSDSFTIETDEEINWILDGEDKGGYNKVLINTIDNAISVIRKPLKTEENK